MKHFLIVFALILFTTKGVSQDVLVDKYGGLNTEKHITLSGIRYAIGINGEHYKQFKIDYSISQKLKVQFGYAYDKSMSSELMKSSFMFKWYLKKNMFFFAGVDRAYESNIFTDGEYIIQNNFNFGVGYEVNPSFLLEFGYRGRINQSSPGNLGAVKTKNSLLLRASF